MKSTRFILLVSLLTAAAGSTYACGPFFDCIPTPKFYDYEAETVDTDRQENLRLWQGLTSPIIPLSDIESVIYKYSPERISNEIVYPARDSRQDNAFATYIVNSNDNEIADFISLAKEVETRRAELNSPWFYPSGPDSDIDPDLGKLIERCRAYKGTRLADRYALQLIRLLFSSRQWDECINEFETRLAPLPAGNLFRRMAMNYVAGCWNRIGDIDKANRYFAESGKYGSIDCDNPEQFMASINPDAADFQLHIADIIANGDSAKICRLLPVAESVIASDKSVAKGNWLFLAAYIEGEIKDNYREAARLIDRALSSRFSSDIMADRAHAYRMVTDAENGNTSRLLSDLNWIEQKITLDNPYAHQWNRRLNNIVQMHWIPRLMERGDRTMAVLLAGYADNYFLSQKRVCIYDRATANAWELPSISVPVEEARANPRWWNPYDYSSLSFQLMYALPPGHLAAVKASIGHGGALQSHLEKYARTDDDYLNELIGTLYLREEDYNRAATYLSKVSPDYQKMLNIYKEGNYLARDPFTVDPRGSHLLAKDDSKLRFANRMKELKHTRDHTSDPEERLLARFDYATGLRNSIGDCWALTQYYEGCVPGMFDPSLSPYGDCDYEPLARWLKPYDFDEQLAAYDRYDREVEEILASATDPETLAELQLRLGNLKTIARHYPDTRPGRLLATSCDHWNDWLK